MNKAYIINFDIDEFFDDNSYKRLHDSLITTKGLISYWHYLHSSYIIIVPKDVTAAHVSAVILPYMQNKSFFICEVNLKNHNGMMIAEAWEWINNYI